LTNPTSMLSAKAQTYVKLRSNIGLKSLAL
jgi:hypothetical protein